MMQSYPPRALDRRLQEDWTRDARKGPKVLMSLKVVLGPWAKYEPTYLCTY